MGKLNGTNGVAPTPPEGMGTHTLEGKQIVVTRAKHQAGKFNRMLLLRQAVPIPYPCIEIVPLLNDPSLLNALQDAANGRFSWLIVTSTNVVTELSKRLREQNLTLHPDLQVAAVGRTTAGAVELILQKNVTFIPKQFTSSELANSLNLPPETELLLPQTDIAPDELSNALTNNGALVQRITLYQTILGEGGAELRPLLQEKKIDALTFTSASTVRNFFQRLENEGGNKNLISGIPLFCIGPTTAAELIQWSNAEALIPDEYTLQGLIKRLEQYFA